MARCLCASFVDPSVVALLLACRLIALDKNPGVRPISVGEVVRCIIAKAVLSVVGTDIQQAAGPWTFSAMTSKCKNGGYSMGTFVQKIVKTELIH